MHHVLDSHGTNSSFTLAAKKLSELWPDETLQVLVYILYVFLSYI